MVPAGVLFQIFGDVVGAIEHLSRTRADVAYLSLRAERTQGARRQADLLGRLLFGQEEDPLGRHLTPPAGLVGRPAKLRATM
jgi:hypothetical protein